MGHQNYSHSHTMHYARGIFIGMLLGAGAMLFFAPTSGRRFRASLEQKSTELRDQAANTASTVGDVVQQKADEFQRRGQGMIEERREHVTTAIDASKTAMDAGRTAVESGKNAVRGSGSSSSY
jgi:gas vesicle protein